MMQRENVEHTRLPLLQPEGLADSGSSVVQIALHSFRRGVVFLALSDVGRESAGRWVQRQQYRFPGKEEARLVQTTERRGRVVAPDAWDAAHVLQDVLEVRADPAVEDRGAVAGGADCGDNGV